MKRRGDTYEEPGPIASILQAADEVARPRLWEVIDVEIEQKTGILWTETATLRVSGGVLYRVVGRSDVALMFVPEADRHVAADASS